MKNSLKYLVLSVLSIAFINNIYGQASYTSNADGPNAVCLGNVIVFTNTSAGAGDSSRWVSDGPGGNDIVARFKNADWKRNFQINVTSAGEYEVCLTVYVGAAPSSVCKKYTGWKKPIVNFSGAPLSVCPDGCVDFSEDVTLGDAAISTYFWEFGGASPPTSGLANPTACYTNPGEKTVTLVVTDANGCTSSLLPDGQKDNYVNVNAPPVPTFEIDNIDGCDAPVEVTFKNTTPDLNTLNFEWDFGDGNTSTATNPTHTYTVAGNFTVSLISRNSQGCESELIVPGALTTSDIALDIVTSVTEGCQPLEVAFAAQSTIGGLLYNWDFKNGLPSTSNANRDTVTFSSPGTYTVELEVETPDGCKSVKTVDIVVHPKPQANFTLNDAISCTKPHTVTVNNLTVGGQDYFWNFGGNPTIDDRFAANPGNIVFNSTGEYNAQVRVVSDKGCQDTLILTQAIGIGQAVVIPSATPSRGCLNEPVDFDLELITPNGVTATSFSWDFQNGSTSNIKNPTTTYSVSGAYNVTVTVSFNGGCPDVTKTIRVERGEKPNVGGSVSKDVLCVREPVIFNCTGADAGVKCIWWPGDGNKRPGCNIGYEYSDFANEFDVSLVCDRFGCKDSVFIDDILVNPPQAIYDRFPVCGDPATWRVLNTSLLADISYMKIFINGATPPERYNPRELNRTFPEGTHTILIYAENTATGCKDSVDFVLVIPPGEPPPVASPTAGCPGTIVSFNDPAVGPFKFVWDFGDGSKKDSTSRSVSHKYVKGGQYQACVTRYVAVNQDGLIEICKFTSCLDIDIYGALADFDQNTLGGCAPLDLKLFNKSTAAIGSITDTKWTIPEYTGSTSIDNPTITYLNNGTYPISLEVTDDQGCTDSIGKIVEVGNAEAGFITDFANICVGGTVTFTDTSRGFNMACYWEFNESAPFDKSTDCIATHLYNTPGNYDVTLIVTDTTSSITCADTLTKSLHITVEPFDVDFEAFPRVASCAPLISEFKILPPNDTTTYQSILWDFGNGRVGVDTPVVTTIFTNIGPPEENGPFYDVTLTVVAANGCTDEVVKEDYIFVEGPGGDFTYSPDSGCAPQIVTFTHNTFGTTNYNWAFGNGSASLGPGDNNIQQPFNDPGVYIPSLILSDDLGCVVTIEKEDPIKISKVKVSAIGDETLLCDTGTVNFDDSSRFVILTSGDPGDVIVDKSWTLDGQVISPVTPFSFDFNSSNAGLNNVVLNVRTAFGCVRRDTFKVLVLETPQPILDTNKIICRGEQIQLNIAGVDTVLWGPPEVVQPVNSLTPIAAPVNDTTVTVRYYDDPRCPDSSSLRINVITDLRARAYPDTAICIGDSIQIFSEALSTSLNQTEFSWEPDFKISDVNAQNPTVWPNVDIQYIVNVKNSTCIPDRVPVNIVVGQLPDVDAGPDQYIFSGQVVELNAFSPQDVIYSWAPAGGPTICEDCQSTQVSPRTRTNYVVTADENGCRRRDTLTIIVLDECEGAETAIANSFTPNGDGINDVIGIELGPGIEGVIFFRVFNRWGEVVFETDVTGEVWDGSHNGTPVNPGVYVYFLEFLCVDGNTSFRRGNITLLK